MTGRSMVEGAPWKHILRFAVPVLLGALLQQLYTTADAVIVGNASSKQFAQSMIPMATFYRAVSECGLWQQL